MGTWAICYRRLRPTPGMGSVSPGQMLEQHACGEAIRGIVQWSGDEPMTKYEIAIRLAEALQLEARLTPQYMPTDATPRPHNCHLDSSRLEALGIGRRTPFDTAIRQVLKKFRWQCSGGSSTA